ncbi:hypothetical protein PP175_00485 [Aneurinibacillus sp. Ricciae_BoGa-3]|uniref:hypothetical protein n=1 Tax=Aneurinibacillus sp. Ricciae_BoGa-3 TaxID=3022697 RepID=UPI00234015EA|nr:hypothetical protein [Aneurinibacillus sp. Ricciae_BoGa-3]WCK54590.1 hypothetical protein PP175_00485 [Aneurinibacillus sp. Ricciae_BoGa-3]
MKSAAQTVIGLIVDDWWMGIGLVLSMVLTKVLMTNGVSPEEASWLFLILVVATLVLSLYTEYRKKTR